MRKLFIHIAALALIASCNKVESPVPSTDPSDIVYATIEYAADTKTSLDGERVVWSSGDEIVVFKGKTLPLKYIVSASSVGTTEGYFKKDADYELLGPSSEISHNVAFYPFAELSCKAEGQNYTLENITLPSVQTYAPASFGPNSFPMMAVSADTDDADFRFKNLCGALKLQLQGEGIIKSITIKGNSDEILAGSASVKMSRGGTPALSLASDGAKEVTLDCGEGVSLNADTPTSFLLALPPTAFTKGFTVTVTDTFGGAKGFITTKENTIIRSSILRMPVKEYIAERQPQEGDYIDEYGINHGQGVEIDGVVWAPVNCGYHAADFKYGKLYQWGRKYGQGCSGELRDDVGNSIDTYSDALVPTYVEGPVSLEEGQSLENANVFYTYQVTDEYRYDWASIKSNELWNIGTEESPVKTEYDPCPEGWRVPTYHELQNLTQNHSLFIKNAKGFSGYWFSGSTPYSEKAPRVFFSTAGASSYNGLLSYRGGIGLYKTSSAPNELYLDSEETFIYGGSLRSNGESVRCVKDNESLISVDNIKLDKTVLILTIGSSESLISTIVPSNANHQSAHWWSDDESVAVVDQSGNVTAVSEGTTIITAMAGMQVATCSVTVLPSQEIDYIDEYGINHGPGVEIDGVVWAPVNCGYHATDFKYGKLYQWGRKYGQGYSGEFYDGDWNQTYSDSDVPSILSGPVSVSVGESVSNSGNFYTGSYSTDYDWLYPQDDALWNSGSESAPVKTEYDPCPEGWRVPTYAELDELSNNYSSLTTADNGQKGRWFSGPNSYTATVPQVFFPAAGCRHYDGGYACYRGLYGYYFSSRPDSTWADYLSFSSGYVGMYNFGRAYGYSVRCVQATDEVAEL